MSKVDVILISMPWAMLSSPSIQLGILRSLLEQKAFTVSARHFYLDAMKYFQEANSSHNDTAKISFQDYTEIAEEHWQVGLGDWIFAAPPYCEINAEKDDAYRCLLQKSKVSDETIEKAFRLRENVTGFLHYCAENVLESEPRIVGFTSAFSQNVASLGLAKLIKEISPETQIVFGGANCDGAMGSALHCSFPWVDVVIRGEAETVFPLYVEKIVNENDSIDLNSLPGICFRLENESVIVPQNGQSPILMNDVPMPDYSDYFTQLESSSLREDILPRLRIPYESSRGCWWGAKKHCTFCGLNGSTMAFRSKSADRVFDEVIQLSSRHKQINFSAVDNIIDMKHVEELLPRLRKLRLDGYDFNFFYEIKVNLKKHQLQLMRDAGIRSVQPGVESLSTYILKLMRKGTTALQNIRFLKWAAQYEIKPLWNIIYGFPGEPPEEYTKMANIMKSLTHLPPPNFTRLLVERFSPYQQTPENFGLRITGPASYYKFIYQVDTPVLTDLAYDFSHEYTDGNKDFSYVEPVRDAIELWNQNWQPNANYLTYQRGIDFLTINDNRPNLENSIYVFGEREAQIYLACDAGATPVHIFRKLQESGEKAVTIEDVSEFLNQLVEARLAFEENGSYISLAIPVNRQYEE